MFYILLYIQYNTNIFKFIFNFFILELFKDSYLNNKVMHKDRIHLRSSSLIVGHKEPKFSVSNTSDSRDLKETVHYHLRLYMKHTFILCSSSYLVINQSLPNLLNLFSQCRQASKCGKSAAASACYACFACDTEIAFITANRNCIRDLTRTPLTFPSLPTYCCCFPRCLQLIRQHSI